MALGRPPREHHLPHSGWEGAPPAGRVTEGNCALCPAPLSSDLTQLHPASASRAGWPWADPFPSLRLGFHTCELTFEGGKCWVGIACLGAPPLLNPGQALLFHPSTFHHKARANALHPSEWRHQLIPVRCPRTVQGLWLLLTSPALFPSPSSSLPCCLSAGWKRVGGPETLSFSPADPA